MLCVGDVMLDQFLVNKNMATDSAPLIANPSTAQIFKPAAMVDAGTYPKPIPFGVTFTGPACSEPRLIELAYAFEQRTKRRVAPSL